MRTLVDIPETDIQKLDALAAQEGRSRAAAIRDAVRLYLGHTDRQDWIERGFGYWAEREDIVDGLQYQLAVREDRTTFD